VWSIYQSINQSINQYRKCLHRDVASTVQIITVHKIQNSKQLYVLKIKVVIARKLQKTDVI